MRQSYLTSKLFEILQANSLVEVGQKLPIRNLTLIGFFEQYNKTGRALNLEAIQALEDVNLKDVFMMLYLDVPVAIYDETENHIYYIFRKEKDVTLAMPVMMGMQNRYQIFSTDKALADEIKDLGETIGGKDILEKLFDLERRIKEPVINTKQEEVPVTIAPKSSIQTLMDSGELTSITKTEKPTSPEKEEEGKKEDKSSVSDSIRKLAEQNNSGDTHMRQLLMEAVEKAGKNKKSGPQAVRAA